MIANDIIVEVPLMGSPIQRHWHDVLAWCATPERIHIVALDARPGVMQFGDELERRHYQHGSSRANLMRTHATMWHDIGWAIISIPREDLLVVSLLAAELGLKVCHTVPVVMEHKKALAVASLAYDRTDPEWHFFPIRLKNVYTLESEPDPAKLGASPPQTAGWG